MLSFTAQWVGKRESCHELFDKKSPLFIFEQITEIMKFEEIANIYSIAVDSILSCGAWLPK